MMHRFLHCVGIPILAFEQALTPQVRLPLLGGAKRSQDSSFNLAAQSTVPLLYSKEEASLRWETSTACAPARRRSCSLGAFTPSDVARRDAGCR